MSVCLCVRLYVVNLHYGQMAEQLCNYCTTTISYTQGMTPDFGTKNMKKLVVVVEDVKWPGSADCCKAGLSRLLSHFGKNYCYCIFCFGFLSFTK